jgi:DNA-binding transcriptional MerR regulator
MQSYSTSQIAQLSGIHPNTVRLYEEIGFIGTAQRKPNGYRVFTQLHLEQIRLARLALQVEVLQNGLRKQALAVIRASANCDFAQARQLAQHYLEQIRTEQRQAEEAIAITKQLLSGQTSPANTRMLTRQQTAELLNISIDSLRNWELNGLLRVKRKHNGYRMYQDDDIRLLKIIRTLRSANYSLAAILRMLNAISHNPDTDIRTAINTPHPDEDIISVCDSLLSSLQLAEHNALAMQSQLVRMQQLFVSNLPL